MKQYLFYILLASAATGCHNGKKMTITGTTVNAKGGAAVITKEQKVYYIDPEEGWTHQLLDLPVQVQGRVVRHHYDRLDTDSIHKAGFDGPQYVFKKPAVIVYFKSPRK